MNLVKGNINFTNEMLDALSPGPSNKKNETINDLVKTLSDMEPKLIDLIQKVTNDHVMNACLCVNDDLHKTFTRWNDIKDGKKPADFVPGELQQETCLEPTHVYSKAGVGAADEDEYYDEEEPEPVQVRRERKATIAQ